MDSVRAWAEARGLAHRLVGDELFDVLPADLLDKCADRRVVATDLARLAWIERLLDEGFEPVLWCDADVLVFDPDRLGVPEGPTSVGREIWVDERGRVRRHVHNAWLMFRRDNPLLAFYRYAAERVVRAHQGPMVPQLVGPKLLTTLHNLVQLPVTEEVNMLPPMVLRDVLAGGGRFRDAYLAGCTTPPAAVNLCGSQVEASEVSNEQIYGITDRLRRCRTL